MSFYNPSSIEHCIIRENFFITRSPILGVFNNNEKIFGLLILDRIFLNNIKSEIEDNVPMEGLSKNTGVSGNSQLTLNIP